MKRGNARWCGWCGADLPNTRKAIGDFCGDTCCQEYHRDLGGLCWALDLIEVKSNQGGDVGHDHLQRIKL